MCFWQMIYTISLKIDALAKQQYNTCRLAQKRTESIVESYCGSQNNKLIFSVYNASKYWKWYWNNLLQESVASPDLNHLNFEVKQHDK